MNRNIKKQFWISKEEDALLKEKAEKSCLTEAALMRMLIQGYLPKEKPDAEFYKAMNQIIAIGRSINQLVKRANVLGFIDVNALNHEMENLRIFRMAIEKKYLEPERCLEWQ